MKQQQQRRFLFASLLLLKRFLLSLSLVLCFVLGIIEHFPRKMKMVSEGGEDDLFLPLRVNFSVCVSANLYGKKAWNLRCIEKQYMIHEVF